MFHHRDAVIGNDQSTFGAFVVHIPDQFLDGRPGIDVGAADEKGLLPLHYAAVHAQPMCAYNLAKAAPQTCLQKDCAGQTPADAAAECDKGEVRCA